MPFAPHTSMTRYEQLVAAPREVSDHILVVDDDPRVGTILTRILTKAGYEADSVTTAKEARDVLSSRPIGLLLSDVNMPDQDGLDLIRFALSEYPDTATLLISGSDDPDIARVGLEYGAYGYLAKPFARNEIVIAVMNALRRRDLEMRERGLRDDLERQVAERTRELDHSRAETIHLLARAAESRDVDAGPHLERMSGYCAILAARLDVNATELKLASVLHDIGKLSTPDSVLMKPGRLSHSERKEIERHALAGYKLLAGSTSGMLRLAASIALTHHEKFDGSGYPSGLAGDQIPIEGRIAAVADVFDALTSDRVYRSAWSVERALAELEAERGKHFDPLVLDAFTAGLDEILALRATLIRS